MRNLNHPIGEAMLRAINTTTAARGMTIREAAVEAWGPWLAANAQHVFSIIPATKPTVAPPQPAQEPALGSPPHELLATRVSTAESNDSEAPKQRAVVENVATTSDKGRGR